MKLLIIVRAYDINTLESRARETQILSEDFLEDNIETIRLNPRNICVTRGINGIKYLDNIRDKSNWAWVSMADGNSYIVNVSEEFLDSL